MTPITLEQIAEKTYTNRELILKDLVAIAEIDHFTVEIGKSSLNPKYTVKTEFICGHGGEFRGH